MEQITLALDTLFVLLGAIMVLAMHAGFAFLEVGTVRHKNQVNALVKILADFSVSTISYFFIGYAIAYGVGFYEPATVLNEGNGYSLVKFFFLLTFAAAIPAIVSGGIAERARFVPQLVATAALVGLVYPVFEGMVWNGNYGFQEWLTASFGAPFMDFAGSVVVHAVGGWIALAAVLLLGSRRGRYTKDGRISSHPPSSIPFLALGSWPWWAAPWVPWLRAATTQALPTTAHWPVWWPCVRAAISCTRWGRWLLAPSQACCLCTCSLSRKTA
jgi:ammonium transporter, Amt family